MKIWEEFQRNDIVIPFPIRTLELSPRRKAAVRPEGAPPSAGLFVAAGAESGKAIRLGAAPAVVGRSPDCQLVLGDLQVSKEHLRIEWTGGGFLLTDLQSSDGTKVNGRSVTSTPLNPLDRIQIGETVLVFEVYDR